MTPRRGCASAEEKPQRGLGICEPFLDGVAHDAPVAARELHPAGGLERRGDLQLDAELAEQIRGQPLVARVDVQHGRVGQRRQALAQQRAQHRRDSSRVSRTDSSRRRTSARSSLERLLARLAHRRRGGEPRIRPPRLRRDAKLVLGCSKRLLLELPRLVVRRRGDARHLGARLRVELRLFAGRFGLQSRQEIRERHRRLRGGR